MTADTLHWTAFNIPGTVKGLPEARCERAQLGCQRRVQGTRARGAEHRRGEAGVTYPFVEYDHPDPIFQRLVAITGVYVYRKTAIKALTNKVIFGDNPSGEIFYVDADNLPKGGQDAIRRILFDDKGTSKTLLQLIQEKNASQGKELATRADLRFGTGPQGQLFVLNKRDGIMRVLVP